MVAAFYSTVATHPTETEDPGVGGKGQGVQGVPEWLVSLPERARVINFIAGTTVRYI